MKIDPKFKKTVRLFYLAGTSLALFIAASGYI